MGRMIIKRIQPTLMSKHLYNNGRQSSMKSIYNDNNHNDSGKIQTIENKEENNNTETDNVMMTTNEKIALANEVLADDNKFKAKRIKKEKGLIERAEKTIILTEDNKELLID